MFRGIKEVVVEHIIEINILTPEMSQQILNKQLKM